MKQAFPGRQSDSPTWGVPVGEAWYCVGATDADIRLAKQALRNGDEAALIALGWSKALPT